MTVRRALPERVARVAGPAALGVLGAGLTWWSWGTWPDVLVDAGREAYLAWQLALGRRLYADLAYLNGPLSPYWNAFGFRLFGVGLRTLFLMNLATLAVIVACVYRLLVAAGDRLTATVGGALVLGVFAFGQKVGVANYNFLFPYSHEVTHGIVLVLIALVLVVRAGPGGSKRAAAGAGLALGLAFLTKPEVFLAGVASTAVVVAAGIGEERAARERLSAAVVLVAAFAVPPALAYALLGRVMAAETALRGTLGAWPWVVSGGVARMPFYRGLLGTADLEGNVLAMAGWAAAWGLLLVPAFRLARGFADGRAGWWTARLAFAAVTVGLASCARDATWAGIARPLPLALALVAVVETMALRSGTADGRRRAVVRLGLAVMGLVLLAKVALNVRLDHYGFALAMPATVAFAAAVVGWLPARVARGGGCGGILRAVGLAAVLVLVLTELRADRLWLGRKTAVVGTGSDRFRADERGPVVAGVLGELGRRPPGTLLVLPEGVMLNYLARRPNPTPYVTFMPLEVALFGERTMLAALRADPPDYVALVEKDTSEYGPRRFGHDYGGRLYKWVKANYRVDASFGARPLHDGRFGVELRRRAS